MTNRILLTGVTGFVGRQVLNQLVERARQVHIVVREEKKNQISLNSSIRKIITTRDLFSESAHWWSKACKDVDTIIHIAWYAEPGKYLQSARNLDCLTGTLQLAKGAVQAGVRRIVGIGTCFEYDLDGGLLRVDTPLLPLTPYAGAKAAAYTALSQYLPQLDIEFAWCRLFYLYGEGEDNRRLIPYLHSRLAASKPANLTNGNQIRDFLDIKEAARMITDIALSDKQGATNICSGIPITVRQMAEKIADQYGHRDLLNFGTRPDNLTDPPCVVGIRENSHHE